MRLKLRLALALQAGADASEILSSRAPPWRRNAWGEGGRTLHTTMSILTERVMADVATLIIIAALLKPLNKPFHRGGNTPPRRSRQWGTCCLQSRLA